MCEKFRKVVTTRIGSMYVRVKTTYRPEFGVFETKVETDGTGEFHRGSKRGFPQFYAANLRTVGDALAFASYVGGRVGNAVGAAMGEAYTGVKDAAAKYYRGPLPPAEPTAPALGPALAMSDGAVPVAVVGVEPTDPEIVLPVVVDGTGTDGVPGGSGGDGTVFCPECDVLLYPGEGCPGGHILPE